MPLVMAMMAMIMLTGLGTVLIVGTMTETALAATYRQGLEVFYAADGAVEFAVRDLAASPDWDSVITGATTSAFVDGPPEGERRLGAAVIDLTRATDEVDTLLNERAAPPGTAAQLFAYGRFDEWLSIPDAPPLYAGVWVAELVPGVEEVPAVRLLYVVARVYGPTGGQRTVIVTVARPVDQDEPIQVRSWEEPR